MDFNTSASAFARAILVLSLAVASGPAVAANSGGAQIVVSAADFTAEHPTILRAFVPTLSSGLCQLTLAESSYAIPGTTTFCGVRQIDGVYGVVVAIFLPEVPPAESLWVVNIRQEKAKGYGDPIPYPGD